MTHQRSIFITGLLILCASSIVLGQSSRTYSTPDRGGTFYVTPGGTADVQVGYGRLQPNPGTMTPVAYAQFEFKQNGITVTEATVPASTPLASGRIYAEVGGPVNTGLALANPSGQPARVSFQFTDGAGQNFGPGSFTIPAGGQIARFLNQDPFNGRAEVRGSFTFTSNIPLGVIALRGFTNERGEFLITTLPVVDLSALSTGSVFLPHFADGGGWSTKVVLVNPTDDAISGTVQFWSQGDASGSGQALTLTVNGQAAAAFPYTIPAHSSVSLNTASSGAAITVGSVRVTPATGTAAPSGLAIFTFRNGGVTVSEAGVPVLGSGTAFRVFLEEKIEAGDDARRTGIAIANPGSNPAVVNLEVTNLDGSPTGLTSTLTVPANGQIARFAREIPGFAGLPSHFHGVLRITTTSGAGVSLIALRGRTNQRGDFLITTALPADENAPPRTSELLFPHIVDRGGYLTEFVLFSGSAGQGTSGTLRFSNQSGAPLSLIGQ